MQREDGRIRSQTFGAPAGRVAEPAAGPLAPVRGRGKRRARSLTKAGRPRMVAERRGPAPCLTLASWVSLVTLVFLVVSFEARKGRMQ